MRAWQVVEHGRPADALRLADVDVPVPGPGQVLLRVRGHGAELPGRAAGRRAVPGAPAAAVHAGRRGLRRGGGRGAGRRRLARSAPGCSGCSPSRTAASRPTRWRRRTASTPRRRRSTTTPRPRSTSATRPRGSPCTGGPGCARGRRSSCTRRRAASAPPPSSSRKAAGARVVGVVGGAEKVARGKGSRLRRGRRPHRGRPRRRAARASSAGGAPTSWSTRWAARRTRPRPRWSRSRAASSSSASPPGTIAQAATNHVLVKNYSVLGLHWGLYQEHDPAGRPRLPRRAVRAGGAGRRPPAGLRPRRARRRAAGARAGGRRTHHRSRGRAPLGAGGDGVSGARPGRRRGRRHRCRVRHRARPGHAASPPRARGSSPSTATPSGCAAVAPPGRRDAGAPTSAAASPCTRWWPTRRPALGAIDLFCANAGIPTQGGVEPHDLADDAAWQATWDVNVMSHVWTAQALVPRVARARVAAGCSSRRRPRACSP